MSDPKPQSSTAINQDYNCPVCDETGTPVMKQPEKDYEHWGCWNDDCRVSTFDTWADSPNNGSEDSE